VRELLRYATICLALPFMSGLYAARPFATDDASTVAHGIHELEFGCDFWSEQAALGLGFKHGITDRMDLGIGTGCVILPEQDNGFEGAELALKFAIIPDFIAASLTGSFGEAAYIINGVVTQTLGPLEIDGNFGYETTGISGGDGVVIYGLAAIFNTGPYAFGIEGRGDRDGLQSWLIGGRFTLVEGFAADIGIAGSFDEDAAMSATAGIHYEF